MTSPTTPTASVIGLSKKLMIFRIHSMCLSLGSSPSAGVVGLVRGAAVAGLAPRCWRHRARPHADGVDGAMLVSAVCILLDLCKPVINSLPAILTAVCACVSSTLSNRSRELDLWSISYR